MHTTNWAVWMRAVEGDTQGMRLQAVLLTTHGPETAPHACQQCPRLQSPTDTPGILTHLNHTAADGAATNAAAVL